MVAAQQPFEEFSGLKDTAQTEDTYDTAKTDLIKTVGTAIKIFTAASFGLLIVIAAYLITRYIGTAFINSLR